MTTTWSPQSRNGVYCGLSLPIKIRAMRVARRPSTCPFASNTNQFFPSVSSSTSRPFATNVRMRPVTPFLLETNPKTKACPQTCQRKHGLGRSPSVFPSFGSGCPILPGFWEGSGFRPSWRLVWRSFLATNVTEFLKRSVTPELFPHLAFFIPRRKPIPYRRFKRIDVYILQRFKPNAISSHARLPQFFPIRFGQVLLIFKTKNINRDSGFVAAHANLKKLPTFSIGIFYRVQSISNRRVRNSTILAVFTIEEPELAVRGRVK